MGDHIHKTIVAFSEDGDALSRVRALAEDHGLRAVLLPIHNGLYQLVVAADGSKLGWERHEAADYARHLIRDRLEAEGIVQWAEIRAEHAKFKVFYSGLARWEQKCQKDT